MKHNPLSWLGLGITLLLGCQSAAVAEQFSADMVQTAGGMTHNMRYYMGDQKMRTEMKNEEGQTVVSIVDLKARKMLQLMPADKMYMEMPMGGDVAAWAADEKTQNEYYDMKRVGSETVNGYACDKYDMIPKKKGLTKSSTWISKKLGMPIKTVGQNYAMELKNIKEGAQPASLFSVPKGYQKMSMPSFGGGMEQYRSAPSEQETEEESGSRQPSAVEEDAKEIGGEARSETKDAIKDELSDSIRKGIGSLFGN